MISFLTFAGVIFLAAGFLLNLLLNLLFIFLSYYNVTFSSTITAFFIPHSLLTSLPANTPPIIIATNRATASIVLGFNVLYPLHCM